MRPDPVDLGRLHDILAYADEARSLLGDLSSVQLHEDRRTLLAVCRCVEIVGEASWKLSAPLKEAHPEIPWALMAGMRHRLAHDYGRVDPTIIHRVVVHDLPTLIGQPRAIATPSE